MNSSSGFGNRRGAPSEALIFKYRNGLRWQFLMLVNVKITMYFYMLYWNFHILKIRSVFAYELGWFLKTAMPKWIRFSYFIFLYSDHNSLDAQFVFGMESNTQLSMRQIAKKTLIGLWQDHAFRGYIGPRPLL